MPIIRPAMEGRSCENFGGYKTINRIPLPLILNHLICDVYHNDVHIKTLIKIPIEMSSLVTKLIKLTTI